MKTGVLCSILLLGAAGLITWRINAAKLRPTVHFTIVQDRSMSHPGGCESLRGLVAKVLNSDRATSNSNLTVFMIGDEATAHQPRLLGRYSIPKTRRVLESRTAEQRRRQSILNDIGTKCEQLPRTSTSPIFLGVKQAIADLRAQGCSQTSHCELFVDSDLEENVEALIKNRLNNRDGESHTATLIGNEGIAVTFCGLAVTAGRITNLSGQEFRRTSMRDSRREDRLRQVWLSVFSTQGTITLQPFCLQPGER